MRGMVFGAFSEASDAVHDLMLKTAVSRVYAMGLQQGLTVSQLQEYTAQIGGLRKGEYGEEDSHIINNI